MFRRQQQILGTLLFAALFSVPTCFAQQPLSRSSTGNSQYVQFSATSETSLEEPVAPEFPSADFPSWEVGQPPLVVPSEPVPPLPVFLYTGAELAQQRVETGAQMTKRFIEYVKSHKNPKITFMDNTWTGFKGRIVSVGERDFTIKDDSTKKLVTFNYADVSKLELMPTSGSRAQETFKGIALGLLMIPLLPLMLFTGWDGC